MNIQYAVDLPVDIREQVEAICARIWGRVPDAQFSVFEGDDPAGTYIAVISDTEDGFDILSLVVDYITDLLLEAKVAVHVVPVHRHAPAAAESPTSGSGTYRPLSIDLVRA